MKKCYEYLNCTQDDCIMHKLSGDKYCWEVEGTLYVSGCVEYLRKKTGKKIDICKHCIYYKEVKFGYNTSEKAG